MDEVPRMWKKSSNSERLALLAGANKERGSGVPARYVLAVLSFLGFANVYALRVNLSMAIVAMVQQPDDPPASEVSLPATNSFTFSPKYKKQIERNITAVFMADIRPCNLQAEQCSSRPAQPVHSCTYQYAFTNFANAGYARMHKNTHARSQTCVREHTRMQAALKHTCTYTIIFTFKGKLYSKIIISELVGFFFIESDGGSPISKVERERGQTDGRKRPKKVLGDNGTAGTTSLVPDVKNSRLRNGLEFDRA